MSIQTNVETEMKTDRFFETRSHNSKRKSKFPTRSLTAIAFELERQKEQELISKLQEQARSRQLEPQDNKRIKCDGHENGGSNKNNTVVGLDGATIEDVEGNEINTDDTENHKRGKVDAKTGKPKNNTKVFQKYGIYHDKGFVNKKNNNDNNSKTKIKTLKEFPLPIYMGQHLINEQTDYTLPYPIYQVCIFNDDFN